LWIALGVSAVMLGALAWLLWPAREAAPHAASAAPAPISSPPHAPPTHTEAPAPAPAKPPPAATTAAVHPSAGALGQAPAEPASPQLQPNPVREPEPDDRLVMPATAKSKRTPRPTAAEPPPKRRRFPNEIIDPFEDSR